MSIRIQLIESLDDLEHFRVLEHLIWGESLEATIPVHVLVTTIHNGGAILGAYAENGPAATGGMIGLTYWWPGLDRPRTGAQTSSSAARGEQTRTSALQPALQLKMCSHMAGVLPAWRGTGLGLRLKLAQRAVILDQGMTDWVTWTYDPLIRTNGAFNLHRLGAVCNTYHVNLYGELPDELNAGVPSDRCQVDWWLNSERVVERVNGNEWRTRTNLPANVQRFSAQTNAQGLQIPLSTLPELDGSPFALPLPDDIHAIRSADGRLGMAWREWMRAALEPAFAAGYVMVDCARHADGQWRYLLMANAF
jgi:predicted GNAT superfamily acetyltransferase